MTIPTPQHKDIISGIEYFNSQKINLKPNVIIIARGGGSIEDLWCFNNEELARSVFNSKIPIISAIGHEPDINIIDYVADLSLATPSHAAKRVVPERKGAFCPNNRRMPDTWTIPFSKKGTHSGKISQQRRHKV